MRDLFNKIMALSALLVTVLGLTAFAATPTVTSVTAQQRYPWNGLVDIVVTISGTESEVANAECTFAATDNETKLPITIAHVTQVGSDTGSGSVWTRRFIWDSSADISEVKIDDVKLNVEVEASDAVQLWEGGPYWAKCNVGASKPEEYGSYFMWGSTTGHKPTGTQFSSAWFTAENCPTYGKNISELQSLGYIDSSGNLTGVHDAATANLGAPWRMPTDAEFSALINNCDTEWTMTNGIYGRLVKGRGTYASKSIFLPAAGSGSGSYLYGPGSYGGYWSSAPDSGSSNRAWSLYFSSYIDRYNIIRYDGRSVRPIRGFAQ